MTKSDTGPELVFVYGTLRRGGSNAFRMEGAEFVGRGRMEGKLHVISWYPGLVIGRGNGWVSGELYRVGPEHLGALDAFEGISAGEVEGAEYRRVVVPVLLEGAIFEESVEAWAYEWTGPVDEERWIPSGDWLTAADDA
jgi:gamma-glutamylcyclotransferase (GGCT)/AIG2-like uncharacterized protein YtfP